MKVLVPIDGSDCSLRALQYVTAHREFFGANGTIALIHVHYPLPSGRAASWVGREAVEAYYDEESEEALKAARVHLAASGGKAEVLKKVGDPAQEIAAVAKGFDMIVMGNQGRTALANLAIGSVATRTLACASVPVLLVK